MESDLLHAALALLAIAVPLLVAWLLLRGGGRG
jgi:hypothetical protein